MSLPLEPYGPIPSSRQLKWHALEAYAFAHFSINTFTDKEWGYGDESPALFNPTAFDADQIIGTVVDAGLKGFVLTCKHHDGFCLWPSKFTNHSVKNSPWQSGRGDMVREFSEACARHGIKFGVYLSPWDRNHADYGTPAYLEYFRNQLRELLTSYGLIFEVWFDGANGGDGYYGGAHEIRQIDNETYYDWENTWQIVRELQPDACMFSDAGPDVRWVGNEKGFAGDPCWATIHPENTWPGHGDTAQLNRGDRDGTVWRPAEVDVSVRPGWFFHPSEHIKPVSHLLQIYFESVGRGANLILNLAPDRRGQIPDADVAVLRDWNRLLSQTFATNLAQNAEVQTGDQHIFDLRDEVTFNVVSLREELAHGQRVDAFALDFWDGTNWHEFAKATSIGNRRLIQTPNITASKVRLRITQAAATPVIAEFGLYLMPALPKHETTIDAVATKKSNSHWKIVSASSGMETACNAIDQDPQTLWRAARATPEIVVDMGESVTLTGFTFLPRQDGGSSGTPSHYAFFVGDDAQNWGAPVASGEFPNIKANPVLQRISFEAPVRGCYFRFQVLRTVDHANCCAIAEINVVN